MLVSYYHPYNIGSPPCHLDFQVQRVFVLAYVRVPYFRGQEEIRGHDHGNVVEAHLVGVAVADVGECRGSRS